MSSVSRRKFWPYDEVVASRDVAFPARFILSSPWLKFHVDVHESHVERTERVALKLATGEVAPSDVNDIDWFFSSLSQYPLSYILPRAAAFGTDSHSIIESPLAYETPKHLLDRICKLVDVADRRDDFASRVLPSAWSWDVNAALEFSKSQNGYDPESLFSVARRFHLLNDLECNKTADLIEYVTGFKDQPEKFRRASALIVRQNHYVTEKCDEVLRASLPLAQSAQAEVLEFIRAEHGHNKILAKALKSLGATPSEVPAIDSVVVLMDLFKKIAERNFLAFAMVVDIFERTSYRQEDPLASLLNSGGEVAAGRQVDVHREINDAGDHENVALGFLQRMKAVDETYAMEALRLAELTTLVIHQLSAETLDRLKAS